MRLNKSIKEQIVKNALKRAKFDEREQKLIEDRAAFAEELRVALLGGQDKADEYEKINDQVNELFNQLPDGLRAGSPRFISTRSNVSCWINDSMADRLNFTFSGKHPHSEGWREGVYKIAFHCGKEASKKLPKRIKNKAQKLHQKSEDLYKERGDFELQIWQVLDSVTTTKRLMEVWPECEPLIPVAQGGTTNLPAIPLDSLNKKMKL